MITRKSRARCATSPRIGAAARRRGQVQSKSCKTYVCCSNVGRTATGGKLRIGRFKLGREPRTPRVNKEVKTSQKATAQQHNAVEQRAAARQRPIDTVRSFFAKAFRRVVGR